MSVGVSVAQVRFAEKTRRWEFEEAPLANLVNLMLTDLVSEITGQAVVPTYAFPVYYVSGTGPAHANCPRDALVGSDAGAHRIRSRNRIRSVCSARLIFFSFLSCFLLDSTCLQHSLPANTLALPCWRSARVMPLASTKTRCLCFLHFP